MTVVALDLSRLRRSSRQGPEQPAWAAAPATPSWAPPTTGDAAPTAETTAAASIGAAAAAAVAGAEPAGAWVPPTWQEVVEDHSARILRLAYRLTGNRQDAEDLTQDVFVRVFRALPTFTPGNFEAWLHRITTNLFLDGARRRKRIRFDALGDDAGERLADPAPGPDERYHLRNLDGEVRTALGALRPDYRAAVVLCDIEGLSYEEVAAALDCKLGTVRSRIHRGRAQLREQLAHRAPIGYAQPPAPPTTAHDATVGGLTVHDAPAAVSGPTATVLRGVDPAAGA